VTNQTAKLGRWLISWLLSLGFIVGLSQTAIAAPIPQSAAHLAFTLPRVSAERRLFLPLEADFLGEYELPTTQFNDTVVGGLSAIAYDRQRDRFYVLSDDRSEFSPARFYTMRLELDSGDASKPSLKQVVIESVTPLKDEAGQPFAKGSLDPEGLVLSPMRSLFISSEGIPPRNIPPFIKEFDLETGQFKRALPIPEAYLAAQEADQPAQGVQNNLGFESLTINPGSYGSSGLEPFRLFAVTESTLLQDVDPDATQTRNRMLHYMVEAGRSLVVSEHLYLLEAAPIGSIAHGLTEILSLDQGGHFLSLERSFDGSKFSVQLFQLASGGASDISNLESLKGDLRGISPIRKQLLLDLNQLNIPLDNLEGMTLGPKLPDGSTSLVLVSDNNFNSKQVTQFLLFRLKGLK